LSPFFQKALANEFITTMAGPVSELEIAMQKGDSLGKEAAKKLRLTLKETLKIVGNPSITSEERLRYLQASSALHKAQWRIHYALPPHFLP
jgi:hypothetical protein